MPGDDDVGRDRLELLGEHIDLEPTGRFEEPSDPGEIAAAEGVVIEEREVAYAGAREQGRDRPADRAAADDQDFRFPARAAANGARSAKPPAADTPGSGSTIGAPLRERRTKY